jgi:hypothetical protein
MPNGVLTSWQPRPKGCGFIKPPCDAEIFAIARDFVDQRVYPGIGWIEPKIGCELEFDIGKFPDGRRRALNVKVVSQP